MTLNNVRSSPNLAHWCGIWVGRGCMTAIILRFLLTILWDNVTSVWEFYMLKSNIDVFFVTSFLCSLEFFLFDQIEYPKRCLGKKNEIFLWHGFWDMTFKSKLEQEASRPNSSAFFRYMQNTYPELENMFEFTWKVDQKWNYIKLWVSYQNLWPTP